MAARNGECIKLDEALKSDSGSAWDWYCTWAATEAFDRAHPTQNETNASLMADFYSKAGETALVGAGQ